MATVVSLEGKRKAPSLEPLLSLCADDMAQVDREILARMRSPVALIPALASHLVGAGGKRMRPLLTVAAARLCGYSIGDDRHIKLATCVEFIHSATLLHDDVVDVSALRRGKPSANSLWGDKASVLVGDFLFTRAFELMVDVGSLDILGVLSRASSTINSKARVNRKSPTSTDALSPHTELAVGRPRRSTLTSTTSSCSRVAE